MSVTTGLSQNCPVEPYNAVAIAEKARQGVGALIIQVAGMSRLRPTHDRGLRRRAAPQFVPIAAWRQFDLHMLRV